MLYKVLMQSDTGLCNWPEHLLRVEILGFVISSQIFLAFFTLAAVLCRCENIAALEGVASTVRAPCEVSIHAFSWALFVPRFQAHRHQVMEVTKIPLQGRKKHQVSSKGLWRPSTSIGEHPP